MRTLLWTRADLDAQFWAIVEKIEEGHPAYANENRPLVCWRKEQEPIAQLRRLEDERVGADHGDGS